MQGYKAQKKKWADATVKILKAKYAKYEWWKQVGGGACKKDDSDVPCDSKVHKRAYDASVVLHRYRAGVGWQPLRIYDKRHADLGPLRHTGNSGGGGYGDPDVYATGGDTFHADSKGNPGKRTTKGPYWPEVGDFNDHREKITEKNLELAREVAAANAWERTNDTSAWSRWESGIKCKKRGSQKCKKELVGSKVYWQVVNPWANSTIPVPHSMLFVCMVSEFKCTPLGTVTPKDNPRGGPPKAPAPSDPEPEVPKISEPRGPTTEPYGPRRLRGITAPSVVGGSQVWPSAASEAGGHWIDRATTGVS